MFFNILAPAVIQHHITLGLSTLLNKKQEITFALMYAPAASVTGTNPLETPNQQTIKLNMNQFQFELGYSFN